jgi:hypothetical protein
VQHLGRHVAFGLKLLETQQLRGERAHPARIDLRTPVVEVNRKSVDDKGWQVT